MNRKITRVAVLGSGVMGSQIACHFANAGIAVLLLDLVPQTLTEKEEKKRLSLEHPAVRNRIVNEALKKAIKTNPSPIFSKEKVQLIQTGNLEDDLEQIKDCDWVVEVIVENLKIKKSLYEKVEQVRRPGTLITSNTSGIPINMLIEGRSEDFIRHFCGTHFFNPPRYLPLLEIIPSQHTDRTVVDFLLHFGDLYLGKTTVLCKDTPAFIANRVGVFSIMAVFRLMEEMGLNIDETDLLTGTLIGHPKSATFRTADVVGIDTFVKVAEGLAQNCPNDEAKDFFQVPDFVQKLVSDGRLGAKSGAGFYKKVKDEKGKSQILTLDISTGEYIPKTKAQFPELSTIKPEEDLKKRLKLIFEASGKSGDFFRAFNAHLLAYVSNRVPEITDEFYRIDEAMKAGFGWELGPFEIWDLLGVKELVEKMAKEGQKVAAWVQEMVAQGESSFYRTQNGSRLFYNQKTKAYEPIPGAKELIVLENYSEKEVWKNTACSLKDIGDGVVCLEWKTKMNTIGGEVLSGINQAIEIAEKDFAGLVLGNNGTNFSAGANVGLIFMMASEQEWEELDGAIKAFQDTSMHIRYSDIPVVVAPHHLTLGGSCEFSLHADGIQAAAETYIGLVETGLGIIPGGGGSKEFAKRASEEYQKGEIEITTLSNRFMTVAMAKTSTSAAEAFDLGIFRRGRDSYSMNDKRVLADAKQMTLDLAGKGYVPPVKKKDITVLGKEGLGALYVGINEMKLGNYISDHDVLIAKKLAYVMCGGDLSTKTLVDEDYLLGLEREAFLSLCGERKTLERIQGFLTKGKIIRN